MLERCDYNRFAEQTNSRIAASNDRAVIGGNSPPGPVESAKQALNELNSYLTENPIIQDHTQAQQAGGWIERTRISLRDLEDERVLKVAPINSLLKGINETYRAVREPLDKVLTELKRRLTAYTTAEENKRIAEAERLRAETEAKNLAAQQAAQAADEAIAAADVGVCEDVGAAIADADAAIRAAGKADRAAARAAREQTVRVRSVMGGAALSMRSTEVLSVTDAAAAIKCMGLTDKIRDAILSSARDYRKAYGELPVGIKSESERRM